MKKLLVCALAIAMLVSNIAFANESVRFDFADATLNTERGTFTLNKGGALKISGTPVIGTFEKAEDPTDTHGTVLKLTNPAPEDGATGSVNAAYINSNFQDTVAEGATGIANNFSYGFSIYPTNNSADSNAEIYASVAVKYVAGDGETYSQRLCEIKWERLYVGANDKYTGSFIGKWYDLRFDVDIKNKVSKVYVDGKYFGEREFDHDIKYCTYVNMNTQVNAKSVSEQIVYLDNFYVNETPEMLELSEVQGLEYAGVYTDDDFDVRIAKANPSNGKGDTVTNADGSTTTLVGKGEVVSSTGDSAEDIIHAGAGKFTVPQGLTKELPFCITKAVASAGAGAYANEEYLFEIDLKFNHFVGKTQVAGLKYDVAAGNGKWIVPVVNIENGGALKVGSSTIATLEPDKWYSFKLHIKPYITADTPEGSNLGLVADVYFMNELVGEDILLTSNTKNTAVTNFQYINFNAGTCLASASEPRIVYIDNFKFHKVNNVTVKPVEIVDLEVTNADGELISSNYESGVNNFTVFATSDNDLGANVTVVAARYNSVSNELIGLNVVPSVVVGKGVLKEVSTHLDIADITSDEYIKVMIINSLESLSPYIRPVVLTSAGQ